MTNQRIILKTDRAAPHGTISSNLTKCVNKPATVSVIKRADQLIFTSFNALTSEFISNADGITLNGLHRLTMKLLQMKVDVGDTRKKT